jgi:hypothetical protein
VSLLLCLPVKYVQNSHKSINDSLGSYFCKYEIEPQININNDHEIQTKVSFLNHNIEWLDSETETKIRIDNNLFSLNKEVTLNNVWGDNVDSVDFANNWEQIKFFKLDDREMIGIRMSFYPCTGLGCSVDYFLLYDVQHKTKNFFGQFRADRELKLYHFNNNMQVDYLSKTYNGDTDGVAKEIAIVYELFSLADNGKFVLQKNNQDKPYFIKHISPVEDTSSIKETLEMQWFEKVK